MVNPGKVVDVPKDSGIIANEWKKAADTTQNESSHESSWQLDDMVLLQCNIDDMTAEGIAHMMEAFISRHGARDVWVRYTHYLISCIVCMYVCDSSTLEVLIIEVWLRLCILQVENIGMKKSRAGQQFNILCMAAEKDKFLNLVFRESTSIGVRILAISRASLRREAVLLQGEGFNYGPIPAKVCDIVVAFVGCTSRAGISKCSGGRSYSYW